MSIPTTPNHIERLINSSGTNRLPKSDIRRVMRINEQDAQCMPIITNTYAKDVRATLLVSTTCFRIKKYSYATTIEIPLKIEVITAIDKVRVVNDAFKLNNVAKKSVSFSKNDSVVKENTCKEAFPFRIKHKTVNRSKEKNTDKIKEFLLCIKARKPR